MKRYRFRIGPFCCEVRQTGRTEGHYAMTITADYTRLNISGMVNAYSGDERFKSDARKVAVDYLNEMMERTRKEMDNE